MDLEKYSLNRVIKPLLASLLGIGLIIVFEAFQQHYYITHFQLTTYDVSVFDLMKGHLRRWVIWLIFGVPLWLYVRKYPFDINADPYYQSTKLLGLVIAVLALCLLMVSTVEFLFYQPIDTADTFVDSLTFFFFQKGPIYLIAYVGLVFLMHVFLNTRQLDIKIRELFTLKDENRSLYDELKSLAHDDTAQFIQVKVGNKNKVVPIDDICQVQAYDYCVKLHTRTNGAYVLRSSMKAMEDLLPAQRFVRIHRQFIVNFADVEEFLFTASPEAKLIDGAKLPVAQSRVKVIRERLKIR